MSGITALIPAAGYGSRMASKQNKQFMMLCGKPVVIHTMEIFDQAPEITEIILITREDEVDYGRDLVAQYTFQKKVSVVSGGKERQHSVWNGLQNLSLDCSLVVVHDGARPLLLPHILGEAIQEALINGGAVVGVPVKDTIKKVDVMGTVIETPPRENLWAVQTPQIFVKDLLLQAYSLAWQDGVLATDDSALVERLGVKVKMVKGSYENIKITTPEDLLIAETIMQRRTQGCKE